MSAKQFIHRAQRDKENPYRMIARSAMEDPNLSYAAAGLLAYILVKPDTWRVMIDDLAKAKTKGKRNGMDCVYKLLKELISEGYITRTRSRSRIGRMGQTLYEVHETPVFNAPPHRELPDVDLPDVDLPDVETPEDIPIYTNKEEEGKKNSSCQIPLLPPSPPAGPATDKELPFLLTEEKKQPAASPPATAAQRRHWENVLIEVSRANPVAEGFLRDSYPIVVSGHDWLIAVEKESAIPWLNNRMIHTIRRKLSSMVGESVQVELFHEATPCP